MATNKKNIFDTLTLKSFDAFIEKLDAFDFSFSYIHEDNRNIYLRGKKKHDKLQEIININKEFLKIFTIKEELYKHSDRQSSKHIQLIDELNGIRLSLQ